MLVRVEIELLAMNSLPARGWRLSNRWSVVGEQRRFAQAVRSREIPSSLYTGECVSLGGAKDEGRRQDTPRMWSWFTVSGTGKLRARS